MRNSKQESPTIDKIVHYEKQVPIQLEERQERLKNKVQQNHQNQQLNNVNSTNKLIKKQDNQDQKNQEWNLASNYNINRANHERISHDNLQKLNKNIQNDHLVSMQMKNTVKPLAKREDHIQKDSIDNFVKHEEINEINKNNEKFYKLKQIDDWNKNKPNDQKSTINDIKKQSDETRWIFESEYVNSNNIVNRNKMNTEQTQGYNNSHPLKKIQNSKIIEDKLQSKQLVDNITNKQSNQINEQKEINRSQSQDQKSFLQNQMKQQRKVKQSETELQSTIDPFAYAKKESVKNNIDMNMVRGKQNPLVSHHQSNILF